MEKLQSKITSLLAEYDAEAGIVITAQGDRLEINPTKVFPSASLIKVPIMYEVMRQAAAGDLSLEEEIAVRMEDRVDGAGILTELRPNIPMTIRELVHLMIVLSDNTATNLLIDRVGMEAVNRTASRLGLTRTVLRRRMMDFTAAREGRENTTCAADMAQMFALLRSGTDIPPAYEALMLDILKRQQVRDKLPFYLPEETIIANKTGTLPGIEHDAGILYLPDGEVIVSVLTANLTFNYLGLQLGARVGQIVYEHFT